MFNDNNNGTEESIEKTEHLNNIEYIVLGFEQPNKFTGNLVDYHLLKIDNGINNHIINKFLIDKQPKLFDTITIKNEGLNLIPTSIKNNPEIPLKMFDFLNEMITLKKFDTLEKIRQDKLLKFEANKKALEDEVRAKTITEKEAGQQIVKLQETFDKDKLLDIYCVIEGMVEKCTDKKTTIKIMDGSIINIYHHELTKPFTMGIVNGDTVKVYGKLKETTMNAVIYGVKKYITDPKKPVPPPVSNLEQEIQKELSYDNLTGLKFDNGSIIKYNPKVFRLSNERGLELIEIGKPDNKGNIPDPVYISITNQPVFINRIFENKDDGKVYDELKFKRSRNSEFAITEQPIPNDILLSSKKVHKISGLGFNFTEDSAKRLCQFFIEIIDKNEDTMERVKMFSTMGWKNNFTSFVIGDKEYFQDRVEDVAFKGLNEKMVTAFQSKGTAEGWVNDTKALLKHNAIRYVCYASCAAPLMKILGQDNRINNIQGENNTTKTIRIWLAMSIWAHPVNSMLTSDNTKNFFEGMAKTFNNLPVHFDETSIIEAEELDKIIYKLGNGGGRGRMTTELVARDIGEWMTVFLMSGEKKITSDDTYGGAKIRAINISSNKMPFDRENVVEYKNKVKTNCENYGVIAPILIRKIMSIGREGLIDRYKACVKQLEDAINMKDNATAGRMVDSFAVFLLAGQLFEEIMMENGGEVKKPEEIIIETVKDIIIETADKPYHVRALEHLYSWMHQKERNFRCLGQWILDKKESTPNDCYGNFVSTTELMIGVFGIREAFSRNSGFTYEGVKDEWARQGIISSKPSDASKPLTLDTRVGNTPGTFITLQLDKIKEKYGLSPPVSNYTKIFQAIKNNQYPTNNIEYNIVENCGMSS